MKKSGLERLRERYASGDLPWDLELPPPEVLDFIGAAAPGRALDLGCGLGRASIYMYQRGWDVDAVDMIPEAIDRATKKAERAGAEVRFHLAELPRLDFLTGEYDFALDVGCGHSFSAEALQEYGRELARLLTPGGVFLLYCRLRSPVDDDPERGPRGLDSDDFNWLTGQGFSLVGHEISITKVEDSPPWPSGWFQFRRD